MQRCKLPNIEIAIDLASFLFLPISILFWCVRNRKKKHKIWITWSNGSSATWPWPQFHPLSPGLVVTLLLAVRPVIDKSFRQECGNVNPCWGDRIALCNDLGRWKMQSITDETSSARSWLLYSFQSRALSSHTKGIPQAKWKSINTLFAKAFKYETLMCLISKYTSCLRCFDNALRVQVCSQQDFGCIYNLGYGIEKE